MRLVVVSCWGFRDAWKPFFELLRKFWPDCPYRITLVTDKYEQGILEDVQVWSLKQSGTWGDVISEFAATCDEPILVMLEDFFLNAPVRQDLIEAGLDQFHVMQAGMVRLYPCPGADVDYGHPHYGIVSRGAPYRIALQAGIWDPKYLHRVAREFDNPWDFETRGTPLSNTLPEHVLAFKRDLPDWPFRYYCSAISRSRWEPAALEFCRQQGITVDTSLRPTA